MHDPGSSRRSAQAIVRTLEAAVRAGRPETARGGARLARRLDTFVERLARELDVHLEAHRFLRLQVTPGGLRANGVPAERRGERHILPTERRRGERHNLAAAVLHAGDVVEMLFKQGVGRDEIERLVKVLHRCPLGVDGAESVATMLWQSDLRRIGFRCRDDFWVVPRHGREQFDFVNMPVAQADELTADASLDAVYSAAREGEVFTDFNLDELPLRRVFQDDPDAVQRLAVPSPTTAETLRRVTELLTGIQLADEDTGTQALARTALARVVDLQLRAQELEAVREVLRKLRPAAAHAAVYSTLRGLGGRICAPQHVRLLASILQDTQSHPMQVTVVRDILWLLGEEAVSPLWQQLGEGDDPQAREPVYQVLAAVCAKDLQVLTQYVDADAWETVRDLVNVIGRIGGLRALAHLGRWKRHEDARVRLEVVRALLTNEQQAATTMLCELLEDPERRVRQTAVWALAARRDGSVLAKLRRTIFETPGFRDLSADERDDFFRAYGRLADEEALQELVGLLEKRSWSGRGWTPELRRGAAIALGESDWPRARRLLEKYAHSRDGRLREVCRGALRVIQDVKRAEEAGRAG